MNSPNEYQFYTITKDAWAAMLLECKNAKVAIDIEQYIFCIDTFGSELIEVLKEKKKEGVQVRILLDMVGSWSFYTSPVLSELQKQSIEVRFFNVISPWRVHNFTAWFFRNHRKTLCVDGLVAFTGGTGIGDYMGDWRDTTVRVHGMAVEEIANSFEEVWKVSKKHELHAKRKIFKSESRKRFFITNAPFFRKRFLYYTFIENLRSATRSIHITNSYFIPDRRLIRALRLAAKRGVEVKVIVPRIRDVPLVHIASESTYTPLLKAGVRIFRYKPVFHHGKAATVDREWGTVGSFNLDSRSFLYNFEANLVSNEKDFVEGLEKHFLDDLQSSEEVTLAQWKKRSLAAKIREFFVGLIRDFL